MFLDRYIISENSEVFDTRLRRIIKPWVNNHSGYVYIDLREGNKRKRFSLHRLVATYFIPNPLGKPEVNHEDGDKLNNCKSNLAWATSLENSTHKTEILGKSQRGEKHSQAKLSSKVVLDIIKTYEEGSMSMSEVAKKFRLSGSGYVREIVSGRKWGSVTNRAYKN